MKRHAPFLLALFLLLLLGRAVRAQSVDVGTPDASAALDVVSTARGLLAHPAAHGHPSHRPARVPDR